MAEVAINLNGRAYRFDCGEGEEARLKDLAAYVKGRVDALAREHGKAGDDRLLVMAALLITDELWDARAAILEHAAETGEPQGAEAKRRA
jgi:cell division protein ZapA